VFTIHHTNPFIHPVLPLVLPISPTDLSSHNFQFYCHTIIHTSLMVIAFVKSRDVKFRWRWQNVTRSQNFSSAEMGSTQFHFPHNWRPAQIACSSVVSVASFFLLILTQQRMTWSPSMWFYFQQYPGYLWMSPSTGIQHSPSPPDVRHRELGFYCHLVFQLPLLLDFFLAKQSFCDVCGGPPEA